MKSFSYISQLPSVGVEVIEFIFYILLDASQID